MRHTSRFVRFPLSVFACFAGALLLAGCGLLSSTTQPPPTIDAFDATPNPVGVDRDVTFGLDVSSDDTTLSCELDVDGDGTFDVTIQACSASGETYVHAYASAGTFSARLRVTDGDGKTAEATVQVDVVVAGTALWTEQFGTSEDEYGLEIAIDADGNVFVVGHTGGSIEGPGFGDRDAFLRKYDRDGNVSWTRQFGTTGSDQARGVAVDDAGNVLVSGLTGGSLGSSNAGEFDVFLRQYDSSGNIVWTDQFGTTGFDSPFEVEVDADQNIIVIGRTQGSLAGTNAGNTDAFVRKVGSDGNELWTRQFGTAERDEVNGLAIDGNGDIWVAGYTNGTVEGSNAGGADAFVRKYDAAGNVLWTVQFGSADDDYVSSIGVDADGNALVSGYTRGSLEGSPAGGTDAFAAKLDSSGNVLWTDQFGTDGYDAALGNVVDDEGQLFVTGTVGGTLAGASAGSSDVFVRAYASTGSVLWTVQYGTDAYDEGYGLTLDDLGRLVTSGSTEGSLEGSSAGGADVFVRRIAR